MAPAAWPPAEPAFERDVPVDEGMFVRHRVLYVVKVQRVFPARDSDAWMVALEIRGEHISRLTLVVPRRILHLFTDSRAVAQHVLDAIKDWLDEPVATRARCLDLSGAHRPHIR